MSRSIVTALFVASTLIGGACGATPPPANTEPANTEPAQTDGYICCVADDLAEPTLLDSEQECLAHPNAHKVMVTGNCLENGMDEDVTGDNPNAGEDDSGNEEGEGPDA